MQPWQPGFLLVTPLEVQCCRNVPKTISELEYVEGFIRQLMVSSQKLAMFKAKARGDSDQSRH